MVYGYMVINMENVQKQDEKCRGYPVVWRCPMCGLPIYEGRCPGGCAVEVRTMKLTGIPPYLAKFDGLEAEICLLDKDDSHVPLEEQYATLQTVFVDAEWQRMNWQVGISTVFKNEALEYIHHAIFSILTEYLYRRDCGYVQEIVEKWRKKRVGKRKHPLTLMLTKNQYDFLKKAAEYYKLNLSLLVDTFTFEEIEQRMPAQLTDEEIEEAIMGFVGYEKEEK